MTEAARHKALREAKKQMKAKYGIPCPACVAALPWNPHGYWAYVFAYSAGEAPFSPIWSKNSHAD